MLTDLFNEVIARSTSFGSDQYLSRITTDRRKAEKVIAAGVLVIQSHGLNRFSANPQRSIESVAEMLSSRGVLGWLFTLFGMSNPWMLLATWLVPALIDWFTEREAAGVCGVSHRLAQEADEFLKGP